MEVNDAYLDSSYQADYQNALDSIDLGADTFTHPDPAIQILAGQGNVEAEKALDLVHTTESMLRAKDALTRLPQLSDYAFVYPDTLSGDATDDKDDVATDEEQLVAEPLEPGALPNWLLTKTYSEIHPAGVLVSAFRHAQ